LENPSFIPETIESEVLTVPSDKHKTILLVEDEAIVAMTESMELKSYGYDVIQVLNGHKAIEVVNNTSRH
jgi:CheY-like chemotaxis protein